MTPPPAARDPFAAYHRARRPGIVLRRGLATVAVVGTVAAGVFLVITAPATPQTATVALASNTIPDIQPDAGAETATGAGDAGGDAAAPDAPLPSPAPAATAPSVPAQPAPAAAPAEPTGPYSIRIAATGYQAEVDRCQWVRMNLGAVAPIVGAHNNCGGAIVLTMTPGQEVDLTGQGLDGRYVVTGGRDAHAGEIAAEATSGITADVLLQTCYFSGHGAELLIALTRLPPTSPSPTPEPRATP